MDFKQVRKINAKYFVAVPAFFVILVFSLADCGIRINLDAPHQDMLKLPRIVFDPNFKNPCWFDKGQFRCLPYWILLGVKKCGTTALSKRMLLHPDILDPGFLEAHWFGYKRFNTDHDRGGILPYADLFSKSASVILEKADTTDEAGSLSNRIHVVGEKSPTNLNVNDHWKELPGNENLQEPRYVNLDYIHHFLPDVKIIILFRNPVERLYSDYNHVFGKEMPGHNVSAKEFHEMVGKGLKLYEDCFATRTVRSCVYEPELMHKTKFDIELGIYFVYWQDLLRVFPREQILLLKYEHLKQDIESTLNSVFRFIKVRELSESEMKPMLSLVTGNSPYNAPNREPMFKETSDLLYKFYKPFNKIMANITGDDYFLFLQNQ